MKPINVACLGMGWWSDVLADAIVKSGKLKIVSCFTRSDEKKQAFAKKYDCSTAASCLGWRVAALEISDIVVLH